MLINVNKPQRGVNKPCMDVRFVGLSRIPYKMYIKHDLLTPRFSLFTLIDNHQKLVILGTKKV